MSIELILISVIFTLFQQNAARDEKIKNLEAEKQKQEQIIEVQNGK